MEDDRPRRVLARWRVRQVIDPHQPAAFLAVSDNPAVSEPNDDLLCSYREALAGLGGGQ
jgi:hypothetical protein